ncbi:NAD(P)-dependent oxidoreductase [Sphingopyxis sp. KK2]|uniref:NAD-dependent epimerase/dehydratase family protein n=1 Tax=Sphingopyxis sp. KK2 TaxID=1855727 RepID=UPI00097E57E4|nr:NAD-dependent epimerase/dehydratase family protein [Sphingopyxis sp. KK2]
MADGRLLLVGGSGYFGARLAGALAADWDVAVTVRSDTPARAAWLRETSIAAHHYDSRVDAGLPGGDFEAIINLAMPGAQAAGKDAGAAMEQGLATAAACLAALREDRAERLIHFSTFHVYGGNAAELYTEDMPKAPGHPYGHAHLAVEGELTASDVADRIAIVRPTNMIGAPAHRDLGEQAGLIFLDLCRQAAENGAMSLRNDGQSYRDILPFGDAIAAVDLLLRAGNGWNDIFNLGAGRAITMQALAESIAGAAPRPVPIAYGDGTDAFRSPFTVDISRLAALGWVPSARIADEARHTIAAFAA